MGTSDAIFSSIFAPQSLRTVSVLLSPMGSRWAGGWGESLGG